MARSERELEHATADAEAWLDGLELDDDGVVVEDPVDLRAIAVTSMEIADGEERLTELVRAARDNGRSWGLISIALGVSKQAARQRFSDRVETAPDR